MDGAAKDSGPRQGKGQALAENGLVEWEAAWERASATAFARIGRDESMTMSDWSKVTRPIPVPNEWTKPFWDAAKQGVLALQRCQACGHFQHPPYATCVNCMGIDLKFEPVTGTGTIFAYTIMYHAGDQRFAAAIPYASIIVELDEAPGALLAGNLLEAPYTEAKVGRRVEVIFQPLNDDITLPQFRLAPAAP